jgi:hypothetical protein
MAAPGREKTNKEKTEAATTAVTAAVAIIMAGVTTRAITINHEEIIIER